MPFCNKSFCRKTTLIKHHRKEHLANVTGPPAAAVKGEPQDYSLYPASLSSEHLNISTGVAGDGTAATAAAVAAAYFGMVPTSDSSSASSGSPTSPLGPPLDYYNQQQYGRAAEGAGAQHPQSPISPSTSPLSYNSHGHPQQHPYAETPQLSFAQHQQQHQPLHLDMGHAAAYQYDNAAGGNNTLSSPLQTPSHEGSPTSPTSPLSPMTPLGHMGASAHVVAAADSLAALGALAMDHLQQQSSSSSSVLRSSPTSQQQYQQYPPQQQQQYQDYQAYHPSRHGPSPSYSQSQSQQHYHAQQQQQQQGCVQNTAGGYQGFSDPTADQSMNGIEYARVASNVFPAPQGIYQAYY
ncbi:hypothetical protein BGW39_008316 [Mortierella sp. 14UC]|nr:hypothetical protein BGW39_008316 [Mortierella sp. 14UC]